MRCCCAITIWFIAAATVWLSPPALAGDEAPAARAYLDHLELTLDAVGLDLPQVSNAADLVARTLVRGGRIVVRGDAGLADELANRPGAFEGCAQRGNAREATGTQGRPQVVVYALGVTRTAGPTAAELLTSQLDNASALSRDGAVVIGLASHAQLRRLRLTNRARAACTVLLDNHCPADDGLFHDDNQDRAVVPTYTAANAALAWALQCEVFAACTRLGRTPVVRRAEAVDLSGERRRRTQGQRFHDDLMLDPIAPGQLGEAYLARLREVLRDVGTASWTNLTLTAERASETILDGGRVFVAAAATHVRHHHGGQLTADPWVFIRLPLGEPGRRGAMTPRRDDFMIALGDADPPGAGPWADVPGLRAAGRGVAWVHAAYLTQRHDLRRGERVVDLQVPMDDALVSVPGYDARLGPAGGVVGEAVLWMLAAQVHAHVQAFHQPLPTARRKPR